MPLSLLNYHVIYDDNANIQRVLKEITPDAKMIAGRLGVHSKMD